MKSLKRILTLVIILAMVPVFVVPGCITSLADSNYIIPSGRILGVAAFGDSFSYTTFVGDGSTNYEEDILTIIESTNSNRIDEISVNNGTDLELTDTVPDGMRVVLEGSTQMISEDYEDSNATIIRTVQDLIEQSANWNKACVWSKVTICMPGSVEETLSGDAGSLDDPVTITVASMDTNGNTGIANLSGAGDYAEGDAVTITAYSIGGYSFLGWYEATASGNSYIPGDQVSTEKSYTFRAGDEDKCFIAQYAAAVSFNLSVVGSSFTHTGAVDPGGNTETDAAKTEYMALDSKQNTVHTITYTGTDSFMYWTNASGNIVSTEQRYTFTLTHGTALYAVSTAVSTVDSVEVIYQNAFNQVISYGTVSDADGLEMIRPSYGPSRMGYLFEKWIIKDYKSPEDTEWTDVSDQGIEATDEAILSYTGKAIHVVPDYTEDKHEYTVKVYTVNGADVSAAPAYISDPVRVGSKLVISTADLGEQTGTFRFWSLDGTAAVSYDTSYTALYASEGNKTLYAVYGSEAAPAEPSVNITQMYGRESSGKFVLSTTMKSWLPDDCSVLESGFVYGTSSAKFGNLTEEELNSTGDGAVLVLDAVKTYKHLSGMNARSFTYTFNGTVTKPTTVLYIRAFVTYSDGTEIHTIYSNTWSGSYNTLSN